MIRTVHRVGYACELEVEVLGQENRVWHWLVVDGQRVVLHQGANVIGRGPVSDVCLDFPGISRRHARIVIDVADVRLEDLGSKNGTTVGDTPVRTPVALHDGDHLAFGTIAGIYRTSKAGMSTETRSRSARRPDTAPND